MAKDPDNYNDQQLAVGTIAGYHVTTLTRHWQGSRGDLSIDGMCGPRTRDSLAPGSIPIFPSRVVGEPVDQSGIPAGLFDGPLEKIPSNRAEVYRVFGDPGPVARPDKKWRKSNIIEVRDLPGIPRKWYFKVHRLAEPYLREGLRRAASVSDYIVKRAGGFVHRHVQHDPGRPLSLHAFGVAIDIDPGLNGAKRFPRGCVPEPWTDEWHLVWDDGVDRPFVEAMESVGFTWGGCWGKSGGDFLARAKAISYVDPMHFELRLRR